ncbi:hypothetical protein niasHS_013003 [Heterodera schachtii]|uniref:Uncharacterized protein n=1 Tax=Heterodera schachtii TaxID=97005 RepID=A0ABD2IKM3_HETSC
MSIVNLFFFAVLFKLPPFLHSLDKAYVTEPFLLTGGKIGKVSVPYFALDQCKPYKSITHDPKAESQNFGLYFLMKHRGGHCDDGILICYPGTLMRNHMTSEFKKMSDFRLKRTFQVGNKKCAQKAEQFVGISNPKQWRGIKVYTKLTNSSNPLSARELILETSLTNRSYTFEPMSRQLSLNFGTRVSMFTWVTTHFGQPFHDEEFDLAEQYVQQMGYGPFLEQHVGLWLLGMDMLPWMAEEYVSLYVYRRCSCTMDAWFTRPTDENDPIEPIVPSAGSSQCPTKQMDETFELGQLDAQHLQADLVFIVLTDEEWQNFTVELLKQEEEDKNLSVVMNFTIRTIDDIKVQKSNINTSIVNGTQMPNGIQQLRFDIFLLEHSHVIMVNGEQFGEVFWPNEWWHRAAWKNITAIRLNGQVLLLYGPELDEYGIENENFNVSVPLPFSERIDGFRVNSTFFFRVQLLNETHNTVNITFTNGKTSVATDQTEMNIKIENFETIEITASYYIGWDKIQKVERINTTIQPTNSNNTFELFFNITGPFYVIMFNGEDILPNYTNNMSMCHIKYVMVTGDAILLDSPKLHVPPPNVKNGTQIIVAVNDFINFGDLILIRKADQKPRGKIIVKLLNGSPECSKDYHVITQMEFNVDAGGVGKEFFCEHIYVENSSVITRQGPVQENSLNILSRRELSLKILMAQDAFYGRSYGDYIKLCPYFWTYWPYWALWPWTIDHVQVFVDNVTLTVKDITVKQADPTDAWEEVYDEEGKLSPKQIKWKRIKYLKINQNIKLDTFFVFVNVSLAKQLNSESKILINFFEKGLEFNLLFGKTVNHIALVGGKLLSFSFIDNEEIKWKQFVNYTLDTVTDDNSANQRANGSDHKPLDQRIELNFTITIDSTSGKIRVEFRLNGQQITKDINGTVLTCCPTEPVPIQDIKYITAYMELSPETDVEMNCIPPEKCTLKT